MNEKVREDHYRDINDFVKENSNDPSSGDAYFAYVVALSRAYREALSDAMKYMFKKDPNDIRIQAAFILAQVLDMTDALWEDYKLGAPVEACPLFDGEIDCGDGPQNLLRWHVAVFPENGIGGIYGGREPEEWVKAIIDSQDESNRKIVVSIDDFRDLLEMGFALINPVTRNMMPEEVSEKYSGRYSEIYHRYIDIDSTKE